MCSDRSRTEWSPSGFIFELENVCKRYGRRAAPSLDIEALRVSHGGIGLLGPNGAGKTTFIKTLLGLVTFTSGSAKVLGLDVRRQSREIRRRVGYMPEDDDAVHGLTGVETVAYAAELCGIDPRIALLRAHDALDFVGVNDERYRVLRTLPPGTRQRFHLAKAIVHGPKLVFLDEPTSNLDPAGREWMLKVVRQLWESLGINVVFSSHILADIELACESVVILKTGTLVTHDRIDRLQAKSTNKLRVEFAGSRERFETELRAAGFGADAVVNEDGVLIVPTTDATVPPSLVRAATAAGVRLVGVSANTTQLEDIFLNVVAHTRRIQRETVSHGRR